MGKYDPLRRHLEGLRESRITLEFSEVERIIGAKLPKSSFHYHAHWESDWPTRPGLAIREAGWGVERLDLLNRRVTLTR